MSKLDVGCYSMTVNLLKWKSENGKREVILRHNGDAESGGIRHFALLAHAENGSTLEHYGLYDVARRDFKRAVRRMSIPDPVVINTEIPMELGCPIHLPSGSLINDGGFKRGDKIKITIERVEE